MIKIINISEEIPYKIFLDLYNEALSARQKSINVIAISSYDTNLSKVCSRYVNLKYIQGNQWLFFTNYKSNKAHQFKNHEQIACLIYWNSIDVQIRIDATIKKCSHEISDRHFIKRGKDKNALAISSQQSQEIESYEKILSNYKNIFKNQDLTKRPSYWGGYSFVPKEFEFWRGHKSRLNQRKLYTLMNDNEWSSKILQP